MLNVKKTLIEGLLIVFSVLFALFIDKMYDDYLLAQKKNIALQSVHKELRENQDLMQDWNQRHLAVQDRITAILDNKKPALKAALENESFLELSVLTGNQSLADSMPSDTAWESAKATGIVAEFDFETTRKLTDAYTLQQMIIERTFAQILDYYFSSDAHNMANLDQVLLQFKLRFNELTGQEWMLARLYKDALMQLAVVETATADIASE